MLEDADVVGQLGWQYNPDMVGNKDRDPTPEDFFKTIKQLGAGTFGTVKLVETHVTGERLAMKIMDKSKCRSKIRNRELKAHILVGPCPFIVRYHSCFQTEDFCYILIQYHPGGSLAKFMDENGHFDVPTTRFYVAEMVEGLLHMHSLHMIHRDIKLTNMLLGTDNHVRLCDLGLCKLGITSDKKTHSRCGALRYSAPEVLQKRPYGKEVDWWSMGVVLYRMLTGLYPFDARRDPDLVEKKILTEEPDYSHISNFTAQDLIMAWLKKTQCERLGYGDTEEEDIRGHAFFSTIDWEELRTRHTEPPSVHRRYMRRASAQRQLERAADEDSDRMGGQDALKKFLEDNSGKLVVIDFFAQCYNTFKPIPEDSESHHVVPKENDTDKDSSPQTNEAPTSESQVGASHKAALLVASKQRLVYTLQDLRHELTSLDEEVNRIRNDILNSRRFFNAMRGIPCEPTWGSSCRRNGSGSSSPSMYSLDNSFYASDETDSMARSESSCSFASWRSEAELYNVFTEVEDELVGERCSSVPVKVKDRALQPRPSSTGPRGRYRQLGTQNGRA
nr:hypothetical protein BaRGS_010753 [Batillaria attramentaria]